MNINRSRNRQIEAFPILAACTLQFMVGCTAPTTPPENVVRPVKTIVVSAGEDVRIRSFPGTVQASRNAELAFQVPGVLVNLPVSEGQTITKGEIIAELRPDEFQARLASLKGQLDQARARLAALQAGERPEERRRREAQVRAAEARLANARADLDRYTRLLPTRAVSQAEFDVVETSYRVAVEEHRAAVELLEKGMVGRAEDIQATQAEIRGLEGRVVEAEIQLADSTLRAPYDGVIAQRFVEAGQNVTANQPIVRIQDVQETDIAVDVPETVMVSDIRTADIVEMTAELSGAPGVQFPVHIREVAQVADPTTQTFNVRVAMVAPPGIQALPGMTAVVTVSYRRASVLGERILVPISAIFNRESGEQVVWIIGADHVVTPRPVKTGVITGGQIEITEGLQPGERIATAGVSFLREGMKVRDLGDSLGGAQP